MSWRNVFYGRMFATAKERIQKLENALSLEILWKATRPQRFAVTELSRCSPGLPGGGLVSDWGFTR